jgi:hypothetical protein
MESSVQLIRKARLFDFYAKYLWRFHRVVARRYLTPRCKRCINSAIYSALDENGICGVCREDAEQFADEMPGTQENDEPGQLAELLSGGAGKGAGNYDALVMVSGGKDSALLLYELVKRFPKLRQLAFTVDNGFMSPVALDNARRYVAKLGIDHFIFRPKPSLYVKSFRYAILHAAPDQGSFETVDRVDGQIGFDVCKNFAARNQIPLLLFGFNCIQMRAFFDVDDFQLPASLVNKPTTMVLGRPLAELYDDSELGYFWDAARFSEVDLPRLVAPLSVWEYNEQTARDKTINLGLIESGSESALVTNNAVVTLMVALDYVRLGYADFEPQFADMVRRGEADRRYWKAVFEMLEYSAKTGWMIADELNRIADSLGIDVTEIGLAY